MAITIVSTTDSENEVKQALGQNSNLSEKKTSEAQVTEEKPAVMQVTTTASASEPEEKGDEGKNPEEPNADPNPKPKKSNIERRFAKITKQKADLARELETLRAENAALRVSKPAAEAKPNPKPADSSAEPSPDDFEKHSDYVKALVKFEANQRDEVKAQEAKVDEVKSDVEKLKKSYRDREKEFKKATPDFKDRLDSVNDVQMSVTVRDELLNGGPELTYALSEDPEEFERLCALPPAAALKEIGRVEAKIEAAKKLKISNEEPKEPKPKPPAHVGSKVAVDKDWTKMTTREYDTWRRAGHSPNG